MRPRVLSYPPVHAYVDRLRDVVELVHGDQSWPRLPDLYSPAWIRRHGHDWDVVHLHFTWEQYPVSRLGEVLDAHRDGGTPVVWTAHDLRNPHTHDRERDRDYLDLLADRADEVVTLTSGAAGELRDGFGRQATVVPHGPLVPPAEAASLRAGRQPNARLEVLLLAKSLRANLDWRTPMEVVGELTREGLPLRLAVHLHPDAPARDQVLELGAMQGIDVRIAPRLDTRDLWRRIAASDVLLLPYRWGTHSGLLELATDLGTMAIVSDVGHLAEQAPCRVVASGQDGIDGEELGAALRRLVTEGRTSPVPLGDRRNSLQRFRTAHVDLYSRLRHSEGTAVAR